MTITDTQIHAIMDNIITAFFDDTYNNVAGLPRIAPGNPNTLIWGPRDDAIMAGTYFMMADMLRLMVEYCRVFPTDARMVTRIHQQAAYLEKVYPDPQLELDGSQDKTIRSSDDAAWKVLSFCDLHRITKNPVWLDRAQIVFKVSLDRFADPLHTRIDAGDGVSWSPYGIRYAGPDNGQQPQNISSSIESGMVLAALYIYEQTGTPGFLNYALGMGQRLIKPGSGVDPGFQGTGDNQGAYFVEMELDTNPVRPRFRILDTNGQPPTEPDNSQPPFRDGSSTYMIQGAMGVATVCAKLHRITGDASWLVPIQQVIVALSSQSLYLVNDGKFLNDRDPYSVGFFACDFVREALSLHAEGIDPSNAVRNAFIATGAYILANPVQGDAPDTNLYYPADWGIPGDDIRNGLNTTGYNSWITEGKARYGIGDIPQAIPQQIMTTSMAGMMALAGYLCGTLTGATLTDGGSILTDNGQTLVDA